MRRTDNYAANQIKILLGELNGSAHADKKKAIGVFQSYVETYQPEVADENVDYLFTGCINGKLGSGLLYWGGVLSDNTSNAHLKRVCRPVVRLLRWLVTHESDSERGNCYYTRFVQLQLLDLKLLNFPKHISGKKKKKKGHEGEDENEDIFILLAVLMNEHRTPQGKISKLELDDLLNFDEEAHYLYSEWVNSGAIEQIPNYRGNKHREEAIDRPAAWEEVTFKCVPLQEGEEDAHEAEDEPEVIPPIPDPLGISSVDLRSIQAFYASGRLMKSQTGQLARRASHALMPIEGATTTGARKTSFRGSTTFVPYTHEADDNSDDEDSDFDDEEHTPTASIRPSMGGGSGTPGGNGAGEGLSSKRQEGESGLGDTERASGGANGPGALARSRSITSTTPREKKAVASVVPSDKNFSTVLFLTLVHGSVSFNQLKAGQDHLEQHLMLQSSRRENLVRLHFGLFVQCAEGLEFLKAYRKGVLKGNELKQKRGSTMRRSMVGSTDDAGAKEKNRRTSAANTTATPTIISSADKGLERLKRSQATLDAAKVEAQRTLAPILERMKQSRRIKSAEKVLKRMTALLEYPMRMRTALERGDLSEVVSIYQRVQAVPTSSSSLRILHKIKEAAAVVIAELKKQCFTQLMAPNANYATLLRYGKIWMDLEGEGSYYELLRQCMIRQVLHFMEKIKEIRDKFCADCADANDQGLEQNLLRRSPFLATSGNGTGDRESISSIVRRKADANAKKRLNSRNNAMSAQDLGENALRARSSSDLGSANNGVGAGWNDDDDVNFREQQDEFAVDNEESDEDWLNEDEADDFIDGGMDDLDFLDDLTPTSSNGGSKKKGLTFSDDVRGGDAAVEGSGKAARRASHDVNHSMLLCSLVRQGCVEAMVELLAKWFPCMFRLVSTLSNMNVATTASTSAPAPLLKSTTMKASTAASAAAASGTPGGKPPAGAPREGAGYVNLNRGAIAPSRILGATLKIYGDYMKQIISGVDVSFSTLTLPSELNSAFNEVDSFIAAAHYPVTTVSGSVGTLINGIKVENKAYDAVANTILASPLREPFHRDALQEVYDLYNAMEFIMKKEAAAVQSAATAASASASGAVGGTNFHHTRVPFGANTGKNNLNFLSPTSPYYDSMNTLQALSKEGEMALAQKIMDRLLDLSTQLYTYDPDLGVSTATGSGANSRNNNNRSVLDSAGSNKARRRGSVLIEEDVAAAGRRGNNTAGMEQNVTELGELIMRCLRSLRLKVKREEWVSVVVQEGVQKVFSSFAEALRREAMKVSQAGGGPRTRDSMLGGVAPPPAANKRGSRRSQGGGMRSSIGNGLVLETLEEELKFGDSDAIKAKLQLDLVRACIRLRCTCIPYIGSEMNKVFALPEEQDKNATQETKAAAPTNADKSKLAAAAGLLSRTKSSLMTKLFTVSTEKDSDPPPQSLGMESPPRVGTKDKKLTLMDVLKQAVKISNVELFEQNLRETIAIEDQAASTYVTIKTKEIRTTIFAGFALLVHNEMTSTWQSLPNGGTMARIPVHIARVLLTLGNEKRSLVEQLGELRVLRGDNARSSTTADATPAPVSGPPPALATSASASRSLFGATEDSASDSDEGEDGKVSAKKAFCEALLYKDHLYKQLCAGVLQIYADLIARLRTNSFLESSGFQGALSQKRTVAGRRNNQMFKTILEGDEDESDSSDSSDRPRDSDGSTRTPYCLGQAIEEYAYLKELLMPLLNHDITIAETENLTGAEKAKNHTQDVTLHRFSGKMFASAAQLTACGRMFAKMISNLDRE